MDELTAWVVERIPKDEDLTRPALTELATELGKERSLWEQHVRHDPEQRIFVELYRDTHLDAWLICWLNQQDTGFHDHDVSSGAVYVVDGELSEHRLLFGKDGINEVSRPHPAGTAFHFDAARIHCVRHPGGVPATSIHVYSPALWRMGYYDFDENDNLCRTSVTYADEMWTRPTGLGKLRA
jgi:Cysteine dioxygenase type I